MKATSRGHFPLLIGQKIERIRTYKGIKQEYLAAKLGMSQSRVSKIEKQENIEAELLKQICEILEVSAEAVKSFDNERITYNINNYAEFIDTETIVDPYGQFETKQIVSFAMITNLYGCCQVSAKKSNCLKLYFNLYP